MWTLKAENCANFTGPRTVRNISWMNASTLVMWSSRYILVLNHMWMGVRVNEIRDSESIKDDDND